jgi:hypothetical protein
MRRGSAGFERALWAQVAVERVASWATVDKLNRSNLDNAMTIKRVQARSLGFDDYFAHAGSPNLY